MHFGESIRSNSSLGSTNLLLTELSSEGTNTTVEQVEISTFPRLPGIDFLFKPLTECHDTGIDSASRSHVSPITPTRSPSMLLYLKSSSSVTEASAFERSRRWRG